MVRLELSSTGYTAQILIRTRENSVCVLLVTQAQKSSLVLRSFSQQMSVNDGKISVSCDGGDTTEETNDVGHADLCENAHW